MKAVEITELLEVEVSEEGLIPIVDPLNGVSRVKLKHARGLSIQSQETFFLVTDVNTGVDISTSGWETTPSNTTGDNRYLWSYSKFIYHDGHIVNTPPAVIGVYGDTGNGILSSEYYYLATSKSTDVTKDDAGWTTTPQQTSNTEKYLWSYVHTEYTDGTQTDSTPVVIGTHGDKGDVGKPFTIAKTYTSIEEMNNSFATDGIEEGSFVIIDTGDADDVDTGKLYIKDSTEYRYVTDMSIAGGVGNAVSFTYVVDSDEALKAWANNVAGNDYTSVLIRKGTWTSDVSVPIQFNGREGTAGVNLTTTGTKVVVGEPESKLVLSVVMVGFGYESVPTTQDYWMRDVQIEFTLDTPQVAFMNCNNLTNCTGTATMSCFMNCNNLTNCTGTTTGLGDGSLNDVGYTFMQCNNLVSCIGNNISSTGNTAGFYICNSLINCVGSATGTFGYGFYGCKGVSNCKEGDTPCTTALFGLSYASLVADERFLCNGTADGGFNGEDVSSFGVAGDLQSLTTTEKSSLVGAINQVKSELYWKTNVWVDVSSYDENTWYPVTGTRLPVGGGLQDIRVSVGLNSGTTPSWSTHGQGFSVDLHIQDIAHGWGTSLDYTVILVNGVLHTLNGISPVSYSQMTNSSTPVLYLRGGGRYYVSTSFECVWTPRTSTYTVNEQSVSPVTSRPTPRGIRLYVPPINHVYTQYPGQTTPASLYAGTTWSNITSSVTAPTGATVWKRTN